MHNETKAVIWDMGGVLLREWDPVPRQQLAVDWGIPLKTLNRLVFQSESARLAATGDVSEQEHWEWIGRQVGVPAADLSAFQLQFWAGDRIDPDIREFLASLKNDYLIALLSNAWTGTRKVLDEYYNCLGLFHHAIISAEVRLVKPDPAIYHLMLDQLEVKPGQAIFVDDLQENIDAAEQLGIHGIHFLNAQQAISDVRQLLS